jgi:UDP:flavonoid glycosyltransferase YjiC (YdhE family)
VLGALTRGLPLLVLPTGGEQLDVAEQCEAVGVGRVIPETAIAAATITQELTTLLERNAYRVNAERIAGQFAAHANTISFDEYAAVVAESV